MNRPSFFYHREVDDGYYTKSPSPNILEEIRNSKYGDHIMIFHSFRSESGKLKWERDLFSPVKNDNQGKSIK